MFYVAVRYPYVYLLYSQLLLSILFFSLTAFLTFTPTHVFIFIRTKKYFLFLFLFCKFTRKYVCIWNSRKRIKKKNIIYVFVRVFLLLISNKMLIFFMRKESKKAGRMDLIASYIKYVKEHSKRIRRKKNQEFFNVKLPL